MKLVSSSLFARLRISAFSNCGNLGKFCVAILVFSCGVFADAKRADFDGDGRTDIGIYRPTVQTWFILPGSGSYFSYTASWSGTANPCLGDFNNDGATDFPDATPPGNHPWSFGRMPPRREPISADRAVCGDYDGDHRSDTAYWASSGVWLITLAAHSTEMMVNWGTAGDLPVADDYDGDGRVDIAVYRPSNGKWYILFSSSGEAVVVQWGANADKPVFADYDGDGRAEIAVYRPSDGNWYMLTSRSNWTQYNIVNWGITGDVPVPGDYDGDGKYDVAQYRPSNGYWFVVPSNGTQIQTIQWGAETDIPAPAMYLP